MSSLHARLQILHEVPLPPLDTERVLRDGGAHNISLPGGESLLEPIPARFCATEMLHSQWESSRGVGRTEVVELIYLVVFGFVDAGANDDVGLSCWDVPIPLGTMLLVMFFL